MVCLPDIPLLQPLLLLMDILSMLLPMRVRVFIHASGCAGSEERPGSGLPVAGEAGARRRSRPLARRPHPVAQRPRGGEGRASGRPAGVLSAVSGLSRGAVESTVG